MTDQHLHLSGATEPHVLYEIIRESGLKTASKSYREFEQTTMIGGKSLDSYLDTLHAIDVTQSSPGAVERSVYSAYRSSFLAGCTYLELRFNPVKRSQGGRIDLDSLIVAARAGFERAKAIYGIDGTMLLCMGRDCTEKQNQAILNKAKQYLGKGISGIDLAGPEANGYSRMRGHDFDRSYMDARDAGMLTTIHCGEVNHPESEAELEYVLTKLKPDRIGHGVQLHRWPRLMELASNQAVSLEICISSNLATGAVKDRAEFRKIFKAFREHGVPYTINTDATFPLGTDIKRENALWEEITQYPWTPQTQTLT